MKKKTPILIIPLLILLSICATAESNWICWKCREKVPSAIGDYCPYCGEHNHKWTPASCTKPETCSCGEKRGVPQGHEWQEATCTTAKVCKVCGETEGEPLGHDWQEATCTAAKVCKVCGETEGEPLGHDWQEATSVAAKTCKRCGKTEGEPLGYDQQQINDQESKSDSIIDIRSEIIRNLSSSLDSANLNVKLDQSNGNIILSTSTLFETGKVTISPEGQELLDSFIPIYFGVLLREEYTDYLVGIIIEGHTDSKGIYESNLKISQARALQVTLCCLNHPDLTREQKNKLQQILTATGRSSSDIVYDENGIEDANASRRIVFTFELRNAKTSDSE